MSNSIRLSQYPDPLRLINSSSSWVARYLSFLSSHTKQNFLSISSPSEVDNRQHCVVKTQTKALAAVANEGPREDLDLSAVSIELIPICSEDQFNHMIEEAQKLGQPVIVVWMASWCRKCIYLKPKLEKLAARCQPRLKFYCVNVNKVPQKLIARAGVNKMPTIQLWKDGNKKAEVIGGHKAHFVIDDVCEMIGGV